MPAISLFQKGVILVTVLRTSLIDREAAAATTTKRDGGNAAFFYFYILMSLSIIVTAGRLLFLKVSLIVSFGKCSRILS